MDESPEISLHLLSHDVNIPVIGFVDRSLNIDKLNNVLVLEEFWHLKLIYEVTYSEF